MGFCTDPNSNLAFLFGGDEDKGSSAENEVLWRFDSCAETWSRVAVTGPTPVSTNNDIQTFLFCPGDNLLVVAGGGVDDVSPQSGASIWRASNATWAFLFDNSSQVGGSWVRLRVDEPHPVLASDELQLVLWDGIVTAFVAFQVVELRPAVTRATLNASFEWRALQGDGEGEFEGYNIRPLNSTHAASVGGWGDFGDLDSPANSFWVVRTGSNVTWKPMPDDSRALPLGKATTVALGRDTVLSYGGGSEIVSLEHSAVLRRLNLTTGQWTLFPIMPVVWPPPSHDSAGTLFNCSGRTGMLLFGGDVDGGLSNETWVFDLSCPGDCQCGGTCLAGFCSCPNATDSLPLSTLPEKAAALDLFNSIANGKAVGPTPDCCAIAMPPPFPLSTMPGLPYIVIGVGVFVAVAVIVCVAVGLVFWQRKRAKQARQAELELPGVNSGDPGDVASVDEGGSDAQIESKFKIPNSDIVRHAQIGEGSFGVVYSGLFRATPAAIKEIKDKEIDRRALLQEVVVLQSLKPHPNCVTFYGVVLSPVLAFVFELVPLGALQTALYGKDEARLIRFTDAQRHRLALDIAHGVAHLHAERVIHRDLAARNVLLHRESADVYVGKLTDFGQARLVEGADSGSTVSRIGPVRHMAPEQMERPMYSVHSDMWSYAVTVWEIEAREMPFALLSNLVTAQRVLSGSHVEFPASTHAAVADICLRCFSTTPADRPTARAVIQALSDAFPTLGTRALSLPFPASTQHDSDAYALAPLRYDVVPREKATYDRVDVESTYSSLFPPDDVEDYNSFSD